MFIAKNLKDEFLFILNKLGNDLRKQDRDEIIDLINHSEFEIAYEVLCEQIYEFDVIIPQTAFDKIKEIGIYYNKEQHYWKNLEKLVEK